MDVVKKIHTEFNSNPPKLRQKPQQNQAQVIQKPDSSKINQALNNESEEQLKAMLTHENVFLEHFDQMEEVKKL